MEYYECISCGQVVQGFNAAQSVRCCDRKNMVTIERPESHFCPKCGGLLYKTISGTWGCDVCNIDYVNM